MMECKLFAGMFIFKNIIQTLCFIIVQWMNSGHMTMTYVRNTTIHKVNRIV